MSPTSYEIPENASVLTSVKAALRSRWQTGLMPPRLFSIRRLVGLLLVSALSTFASERVFDVEGVVRAPLENGRIVIAHADIPGYMPAMTMGFNVADPAEAVPFTAGDRVRFRLHVDTANSSATDFMLLGRETPAAPAGGRPLSPRAARLVEGDALPEFSLVTEDNQSLTSAWLRGRVTLVTFVFTRCPVPEYCPAVVLRFGQVQNAVLADTTLADRVRLLCITLDPAFDRPEILKAYSTAVGADPRVWRFATGTAEQIAALTKAFAVFVEKNGVTLDHTLCTALIDADGRVVEFWRGGAWRSDEVLTSIRDAVGGGPR